MAKKTARQPPAPERAITTQSEQVVGTKRKRNVAIDTTPQTPAKAVKQEMRDCDICAETKPLYRRFPSISSCDHDPTVCTDCYKTHFVTRIDADRASGWHACDCPLCGEAVSEEDVRGILPRPLGKELDMMIRQAQKSGALNWLWCPAEGCGHGQIHQLSKNPFVSCAKCKTKICINHQRKWHEGKTCHEFDEMSNQNEAAKKDMDEIRRTTKPCPFCKMRVKKEGGCNHMICASCRKHWLWDEVPFDGEQQGTSAEILGGPEGAAPLGGAVRQAVEQVMHFENNQIDQPVRTLPLDFRLDVPPPLVAMFERVGQMAQTLFGHARPAIAPRPQPQHVNDHDDESSPEVRVSAVRSTQPQHRIETVLIGDDDSTNAEEAAAPVRPADQPPQPPARRRGRRRGARHSIRVAQQIIELTDENTEREVTDLTGAD